MGSQFLEKHKRKSVLAALLLLFSGNAKYVVILLLVIATSIPFVVSRDTLSRLLDNPSIAYVMRHLGLGSVLSAINPKYSSDMLKSAMDRALAESEQNSYWSRFLRSLNGGGAGGKGGKGGKGGAGSGLDMITGGGTVFGDDGAGGKGKKGKGGKGGAGEDGADGSGEGGAGGSGDTVYLDGGYGAGGYGAGGYGKGGADGAGGPGGGLFGSGGLGANGFGGGAGGAYGSSGGGLYGNLMGNNLADRYNSAGGAGGAGGSGSGGYGSGGSLMSPYIGKNSTGNGGTAAGKGGGRYNSALGATSGRIPVPGSPERVNAKSLGRVSGFSWRNVGSVVTGAKMTVRLGQEASIYRLADTYAMTTSAAHFTNAAPEYKASYTGATYDGNAVNLDLVETVQDPPVVSPDVSYIDNQLVQTIDIQEAADVCTTAQGTHGTAKSDAMTRLTVKQNGMTAPNCDNSGAVNAWNNQVSGGGSDSLLSLCIKYNTEDEIESALCQVNKNTISCAMYSSLTTDGGMLIKYCPKPGCKCSWKNPFCCLLWLIFWALFIAVMIAIFIIFGPLVMALTALFTVLLLDLFFPDGGGVPAGLDQAPAGTTDEDWKKKFDGDGTV